MGTGGHHQVGRDAPAQVVPGTRQGRSAGRAKLVLADRPQGVKRRIDAEGVQRQKDAGKRGVWPRSSVPQACAPSGEKGLRLH